MNDPTGLGSRCPSEGSEFHRRELPPFSNRQPLQLQWTESNSTQPLHRMPDAFHQPSNLTVSAFAEFDVEPGSIPVASQHRDSGLRGAGRRPLLSIAEIQTLAEFLDLFLLHTASNADVVAFVDFVARVGQSIRQLTVVGQEKQTGTVDVESSD